MIFNIPQFIDTEDKIVGPLTAKQIGWMFGAAAILFLMWVTLDTSTFYISAVPVVALAAALAFYRPYNQSLAMFILSSIYFVSRSKQYVWKRLPDESFKIHKNIPQKSNLQLEEKHLDSKKIQEISDLLDLNKK